MDLITPDEVLLQPDDYDLPGFTKGWAKAHLEKMKQPVKVTRRQMEYFGERGATWTDIEKFYGVDRVTLRRYYAVDYEKGVARTNVALRNKMVELALAGNPTMLIWLAKNRLDMSDAGPTTKDEETAQPDEKMDLKITVQGRLDDPRVAELEKTLLARIAAVETKNG